MKAGHGNALVKKVLAVQENVEQEQQEGEEGGQGSGAGGQGGEESEEEEEQEDPEKPAAAVKPSLLQMAAGLAQSKGALVKRATEAEALAAGMTNDLAAARNEIATLRGELVAANTMLAERDKELADVRAALESAGAEAKTVEAAAVDLVAGLGVDAGKLPAATVEDETVEGLQARLKAETNPQKRWEMAERINDLRFAN